MIRPMLIIAAAGISLSSCAANQPTPTVTAHQRLTEVITVLRTESIGAAAHDWNQIEARLIARLSSESLPADADPLILEALAELNDPHFAFDSAAKQAAAEPESTAPPPAEANEASNPVPAASPSPPPPPIPTEPVGRMLNDEIAYLLLPMRGDADSQTLQAYAAASRSLIEQFASQSPRGWIIDLRLNGGGTIWPMLLAIEPFVGNGPVLTSIGAEGITATFGLTEGAAWLDAGKGATTQLEMPPGAKIETRIDAPLAVLTGPWTMSSGEGLAIALRTHPTARTFGEPTAGLTTVTQIYTLSDGSKLTVPVARMGDINGQAILGALHPDESVSFDNWPSDNDAVVQAAIQWLISQPRHSGH